MDGKGLPIPYQRRLSYSRRRTPPRSPPAQESSLPTPSRRTHVRSGTGVAPEAEPDPFLGDESAPARARGWAYANFATDKATWNMTCSGVSSLMILYSHGGHALTPERRAEVTTAIRDGLGWMMENWTDPPHGSAYAVYSLEKVADIGGIARFDEYDWYPDARDWILGAQHPTGPGTRGEPGRSLGSPPRSSSSS